MTERLEFPSTDLGRMAYREAYARQQELVDRIVASRESPAPIGGHILLVEHDPVITVSARPGSQANVVATMPSLAAAGVAIEPTDRGGDVTYHGPGQLVVYPIIDLNAVGLRLHEYMRLLEAAVIDVCRNFGVHAQRDTCATGVWVGSPGAPDPDRTGADTASVSTASCSPAAAAKKICAMGVRIRRWVSMHGLALNVSTNLEHFNLIVPCGLVGRGVTSLQQVLGPACPTMVEVKAGMLAALRRRLAEAARGARPGAAPAA